MQHILLSDILQQVADAETREEKIILLRQNNTTALRTILATGYDPKIVIDANIPSYRENSEVPGYAANSLNVEFRRLYIFTALNKAVKPEKKSNLLAQILESIDAPDAAMLVKLMKKDVSEYGLTTDIINEAIPGLISL